MLLLQLRDACARCIRNGHQARPRDCSDLFGDTLKAGSHRAPSMILVARAAVSEAPSAAMPVTTGQAPDEQALIHSDGRLEAEARDSGRRLAVPQVCQERVSQGTLRWIVP